VITGTDIAQFIFTWKSLMKVKLFDFQTFKAYIKRNLALLYSKNRMGDFGMEYAKYKSRAQIIRRDEHVIRKKGRET
jgi:hypothetical protein